MKFRWAVVFVLLVAMASMSCAGTSPGKKDRLAPLPPDIPLPSLPANGLDWTPGAVILQPWGEPSGTPSSTPPSAPPGWPRPSGSTP